MGNIQENLAGVRQRIEAACRRAGRPATSVRLVAVSKTFAAEAVQNAAAAGQQVFGENRIQEAATKIEALRSANLRWHLIGHLQSNKARKAVELFDLIESIDSLELAARVSDIAGKLGKRMPVLLQVHLGNEETKHGFDPEQLREQLPELLAFPHMDVRGLMAIPPFLEDPEKVRPYFLQLRTVRDRWNAENPSLVLTELSMGMSSDFEVAIEEGATLIRVGTGVFGKRGG
ncbi:MAG: YggS family pyridoxal phosphate-dependent enzyme [Acidobacteriota bacterium]